ncbi:hypothetical protein Q31b_20720 [Novipirellula aureliae]|uniref:Uncharacterized protein n=1 Tax=Novipirellula aureliae TaxID=2527966 RepID=A0A5C6E520_9BACT|nr:hypothetical protein Q31b_20720 [Novipirellula aureliae]
MKAGSWGDVDGAMRVAEIARSGFSTLEQSELFRPSDKTKFVADNTRTARGCHTFDGMQEQSGINFSIAPIIPELIIDIGG